MYPYFVGVWYDDIEHAYTLKRILENMFNPKAVVFEHDMETLRFLVGLNACEKTRLRRFISRKLSPGIFKAMVFIETADPENGILKNLKSKNGA